jgi:formylglycine-generating enzyme required for sulfatase activity
VITLGSYRIMEQVGAGGMGVVFRAQTAEGSFVAVKLLRRGAKEGRFQREQRLLGLLGEKEGFVPLLDSGESPHGLYYVMPFLGGGTLRKKLSRPMPVHELLALGRFLAGAMGAAHAKGIIHRDLKPENILFTAEGRPLVADLGLAKHWSRDDTPGASQSVSLSIAGDMKGTAGYMAPEQMRDSKNVDPSADVFAIGAILYECAAGKPAFSAPSLMALVSIMETAKHDPVAGARPDLPGWLARVIEKTLAADARERYGDGFALLEALNAPKGDTSSGKRVGLVVAALAAALTIALALVLALGSGNPPPPAPPVPVGPAPPPTPKDPTAWYQAIPDRERPRLPRGVRPTENDGEYLNEKDGTILVLVPGGECLVGLDQRTERIPAFLIAKLEVTNAQFEKFVTADRFKTSAETGRGGFVFKPEDKDPKVDDLMSGYTEVEGTSWRNPDLKGPPPGDNPVVTVSWSDAVAYCKWAGLVLPTLDQWEKAASWVPEAKRARAFPWGDEFPSRGSPHLANLGDITFTRLWNMPDPPTGYDDGVVGRAPVGTFPLDRAPCGALDMGGNVSEWCRDVGPDKGMVSVRWYRGGNFSWPIGNARSTFRPEFAPADSASEWVGFRPAVELSPR